jgi:hypothetical protein
MSTVPPLVELGWLKVRVGGRAGAGGQHGARDRVFAFGHRDEREDAVGGGDDDVVSAPNGTPIPRMYPHGRPNAYLRFW